MKYAGIRAGGGKTYAYALIATRRSSNKQKTIVISPSINLILETRALLQSMAGTKRVIALHGEDGHDQPVITRVAHYLNHDSQPGDILLITHQCFLRLPYFPQKSRWRLLIDEDVKLFDTYTLNLHENHRLITDHIQCSSAGSFYERVTPSDKAALKRIKDNKNDDQIWKGLYDVTSALIDDAYACYVNNHKFNELTSGLKPKAQLTVFAMRGPKQFEGFASVTVASAWFEDSLTYHYWQSLGVDWSVDQEVMDKVVRPHHPHNPNLTIYYGYDGRYSKAKRNQLEKAGNIDLWAKALAMMGEDRFLWLENNDRKDASKFRFANNGERLPAVSSGLNQYSEYRHAIVLYATNYTPDQANFLSRVAQFDKDQQSRAMAGNLYQAFMRTAIRNDEIGEETKWVVGCRQEAELLSQRFPGCVIKELGLTPIQKGKSGRPRKYENDNDRKRAYDRRKKQSSTLRVDFVQSFAPAIINRVVFLNEKDETTCKTISDFVRLFQGSYFNNMKDTSPKVVCRNDREFIDWLKDMHSQVYQQKDDIPAITGALFDPSIGNGGYRKKEHVSLCRGIWVDIEGGDLTVKLFERAFPQLQFVSYNTFRHTKEAPRFRIYIPTDRAMTEDESETVYHEIRSVLKSQGWKQGQRAKAKIRVSVDDQFDGIDHRPNPSQLSLLPCQAQDRKASFFIDRTLDRKPLNVNEWLKQGTWMDHNDRFYDLPAWSETVEGNRLSLDQISSADEAMTRWNCLGILKGEGNDELFKLFLSLRRARLPYVELSYRLYDAASKAHTPRDRKLQADRLLKGVKFKM